MMKRKQRYHRSLGAIGLFGVMLAACTTAPVGPTPTLPSPTDAATMPAEVVNVPSPTVTLPAVTPTIPPRLETPSPTFTAGPPTETYTPSPTPGPYEYIIQPGDTLLYILQLPPFNYTDPGVISEVLRLNPQITSADRLPGPGSVILIPRQTPTETPPGFELTAAIATPVPVYDPASGPINQVTVREGETILGLAASNETTLVILATLNPQLSFFNCNFSNPSGGPDCNVPLQVGELVNVPALTPTPTLTPTFSGSETPTPTPTFAPPILIFPPAGASASARTFQLQWLSAGVLRPEQVYIVQIEDTVTGAAYLGVTRATSYELPEDLIPSDGQPHLMRWRVSVGAATADPGVYRFDGPEGNWREFIWQSR
ncbi:MAG: hypothetical protein ACUVS2_09660 [Candidatus Flexifilum sp.]